MIYFAGTFKGRLVRLLIEDTVNSALEISEPEQAEDEESEVSE